MWSSSMCSFPLNGLLNVTMCYHVARTPITSSWVSHDMLRISTRNSWLMPAGIHGRVLFVPRVTEYELRIWVNMLLSFNY